MDDVDILLKQCLYKTHHLAKQNCSRLWRKTHTCSPRPRVAMGGSAGICSGKIYSLPRSALQQAHLAPTPANHTRQPDRSNASLCQTFADPLAPWPAFAAGVARGTAIAANSMEPREATCIQRPSRRRHQCSEQPSKLYPWMLKAITAESSAVVRNLAILNAKSFDFVVNVGSEPSCRILAIVTV